MKGTSVYIKNMWIKQLCNRKVQDFAMAFTSPKRFLGFRETGPRYLREISRETPGIPRGDFSTLRFAGHPEEEYEKKTISVYDIYCDCL